jgi:protein-arginine kinase activator protein McsA
MICPHCNYSHSEYDPDSSTSSKGIKGNFYKFPIEMKRHQDYQVHDEMNVYGCPNCFKVFIYRY